MTITQLKYVLAIADNDLNVTAAANSIPTSQPGVSKQVKMLEAELGVQMFVRHGKSLREVTGAGQMVIERARVIMREIEGLLATLSGERMP